MLTMTQYVLFCLIACPIAFCAVYEAFAGHTLRSVWRYSNRKIGGIRFMRFDRLSISFCVTR